LFSYTHIVLRSFSSTGRLSWTFSARFLLNRGLPFVSTWMFEIGMLHQENVECHSLVYTSPYIHIQRYSTPHFADVFWTANPEVGLASIEWVVVDEADVLFGM
jgi:hypothetical protein